MTHPLSAFGPGVIGEEAAAYFAKQAKEERNVFGPGVVGEEAKETPKPLDLSIKEMERQLEANPALFEEFFLGELSRPVPRRGALHALLDHQKAQSQPQPDIVAILESKLNPTVTP